MEIQSTSEMSPYFTMTKCNKLFISERSEPLSRVFNDQPRGIYMYMVESVRTYVSNTHAHVRMSVCY